MGPACIPRLVCFATVALTVALTAALAAGRPAAQATVGRPTTLYQYAVKVLCGTVSTFEGAELGHVSGRYQTAINVHNPEAETVIFSKRLSIALPFQQPGPHGKFDNGKLAADDSLQIECREIMTELTPAGFLGDCLATDLICIVEGFLIIRSPVELDVVAVYTAANRSVPNTFFGSGDVTTMEVEVVQPRKVSTLSLTTAPDTNR
jgi:hypothetical protein